MYGKPFVTTYDVGHCAHMSATSPPPSTTWKKAWAGSMLAYAIVDVSGKGSVTVSTSSWLIVEVTVWSVVLFDCVHSGTTAYGIVTPLATKLLWYAPTVKQLSRPLNAIVVENG